MTSPAPVALVADAPRAGLLLKPLRLKILAEAREPASAATIADRLGLPRQKVNYHVRQLARGGFLKRAGRLRKRGLVEQRYVVTAKAFLLGPGVLGPMSADVAAADDTDKTTAAYLMVLGARMQREAGGAWRQAQAAGARLPVLSLDAEVSFPNTEARARFARALTDAVTRLVAEHASPRGAAHPYRLVLGCYPIPTEEAR